LTLGTQAPFDRTEEFDPERLFEIDPMNVVKGEVSGPILRGRVRCRSANRCHERANSAKPVAAAVRMGKAREVRTALSHSIDLGLVLSQTPG
jgi:hypothetical protein